MECKIFVRRNFGKGYKDAWPRLSFFQRKVYWRLIRGAEDGVSKKLGFWLYHFTLQDDSCTDPGARRRHPAVEVTIVFPWRIKGCPTQLEGWDEFVRNCESVALGIHRQGIRDDLTVAIPDGWMGGSEW